MPGKARLRVSLRIPPNAIICLKDAMAEAAIDTTMQKIVALLALMLQQQVVLFPEVSLREKFVSKSRAQFFRVYYLYHETKKETIAIYIILRFAV